MKRIALVLILLLLAGCNPPTQTASPVSNTSTSAAVQENTPTAEGSTPSPPATSPAPEASATATIPPLQTGWIAYIGLDGNLALIDPVSMERLPVTSEAAGLMPAGDQPSVIYGDPQWSSDGTLLAFTRQENTPLPDRMEIQTSLWVYNLTTRQSRSVLQTDPALIGFRWKPGAHVLAFAQGTDPNYFARRGQVDASLARGIQALDVDSGQVSELVPPERGNHLRSPIWAPDGSQICFEEVIYMEGRGPFGCYQFSSKTYISWERAIGTVAFSPDSQQIAYDELNYAPSGEERIYLNDPAGKGEQAFGPTIQNGYAFGPVWSPQGDRIAYIGVIDNNGQDLSKLYVQGLDESYPQEVGLFENPAWVSWAPDGQELLLAIGPYQQSQIVVVELSNGMTHPLDQGMSPAWQP